MPLQFKFYLTVTFVAFLTVIIRVSDETDDGEVDGDKLEKNTLLLIREGENVYVCLL